MTTAENIEVFLANPALLANVRTNLNFNITPENVILSVVQGCIHMSTYEELSGSQKKQLLLRNLGDVVETQQLDAENKAYVKRVLALSAPAAIDSFCFGFKEGKKAVEKAIELEREEREAQTNCSPFGKIFGKKK